MRVEVPTVPIRPGNGPTRARPALYVLMVLSVALVAALAAWDDARESSAALEDFASEQSAVTQATAAGLSAQLEALRREALTLAADETAGLPVQRAIAGGYVAWRADPAGVVRDAPGDDTMGLRVSVVTPAGGRVLLRVPIARLLPGSDRIERPDERLVLLLAPEATRFRTMDGRDVPSAPLRDALERGRSTLRLERPEAARLGLPARMAMAGLARLDAGALGHWGVAVVTSASRERDRERRARWRLVLGVLVAAALVGAFGSVALATERRGSALTRRLAAHERERVHESALEREGRAATMVTLAAGIAHEVSTPLGVIAGRAEQLSDRIAPDDARATRCIAVILEQTRHIRDIIQGLLHVARGGDPVLEPVDLAAVVTRAMDSVQHRFEASGVSLIASLPAGRRYGLRGDPRLIEHALVNLLLNACDACGREGHVTVTLHGRQGDVQLGVEDDGVGIDPASAARVGEPFFSTKPRDRGTGLGLAIATEIVRIHRGELTLAPARPHGTRATLTLPTTEEEPGDGLA